MQRVPGIPWVQDWKLFNSIDTLEQERAAAITRREAERSQKIAALEARKQPLQKEIAKCKGLFSIGKRRELENRLAQIEEELSAL